MWYLVIGAVFGLFGSWLYCRIQLDDYNKSPLSTKLRAIRMAPVIFVFLVLAWAPLLALVLGFIGLIVVKDKLRPRRAAAPHRPIPRPSPVP